VLLLYRRRSPSDGTVEVRGDAGWLDTWWQEVGFG
jgi:hypothetical protein